MGESIHPYIFCNGLALTLAKGFDEGCEFAVREGQKMQARATTVRFGTSRFGKPDEKTITLLDAIEDLDRLNKFIDLLVFGDVKDWPDLLNSAS